MDFPEITYVNFAIREQIGILTEDFDTEDLDHTSKEDWAIGIQMAVDRQDGGPLMPMMVKAITAVANGNMTKEELLGLCAPQVASGSGREKARKARDAGGAQTQDSPFSTPVT